MTRSEEALWDGVCVAGGVATLLAIGAAFMGADMGLLGIAGGYLESEAYTWADSVEAFWRGFWFAAPIMFGLMAACATISFLKFHLEDHSWRSLVPAFLWPEKSKTETTVLTRVGRVLHWLTVPPAACAMFLGFVVYWTGKEEGGNVYVLGGLAGAPAFLLFGRALRYIFAGE